MGESMLGRPRRLIAILVSVGLAIGLLVITAGVVSAAPGGNSTNAKICKDWASLYREDGSTFADRGECTSYAAEGGTILTSPPVPPLPNRVVVETGATAGTYGASGAEFGPSPTSAGVRGDLVLVDDGTTVPTEGCSPLVGFTAGAIAIVDRGGCAFTVKVSNAQAAGAVAVVVANNVAGVPTTMDGTDSTITIPAVMVSQSDGATIKAGLPATGTVASS